MRRFCNSALCLVCSSVRFLLCSTASLFSELNRALIFVHPWQYREVEAALGRIQPLPDHVVFAESLEYLVEEAMAICLGLEGCRGAWARAREELLRVRAQDGGSDIATAGSAVGLSRAEDGDVFGHHVLRAELQSSVIGYSRSGAKLESKQRQ